MPLTADAVAAIPPAIAAAARTVTSSARLARIRIQRIRSLLDRHWRGEGVLEELRMPRRGEHRSMLRLVDRDLGDRAGEPGRRDARGRAEARSHRERLERDRQS